MEALSAQFELNRDYGRPHNPAEDCMTKGHGIYNEAFTTTTSARPTPTGSRLVPISIWICVKQKNSLMIPSFVV